MKEINEAFDKLMKQAYEFSEKAIRLDNKPKLEDFTFVDDYFHKFLAESERVHQLIGGILSLYLGHKIMSEILKQTKAEPSDKDSLLKYHGQVLPSSVHRKIYTFSSLMGIPKEDIEIFDRTRPSSQTAASVSLQNDFFLKLF